MIVTVALIEGHASVLVEVIWTLADWALTLSVIVDALNNEQAKTRASTTNTCDLTLRILPA